MTINRKPEFQTIVSEIEPIAKEFLSDMREQIQENHPSWKVAEIGEMQKGKWTFFVKTTHYEFNVSFEIVDSIDYEGTFEGYNVSFEIITLEGRILGTITPYNYTDKVWTKNIDELKNRAKKMMFSENIGELL